MTLDNDPGPGDFWSTTFYINHSHNLSSSNFTSHSHHLQAQLPASLCNTGQTQAADGSFVDVFLCRLAHFLVQFPVVSLLLFSAIKRFLTARAAQQMFNGQPVGPNVSDREKGDIAAVLRFCHPDQRIDYFLKFLL